MSSQPHGRDLTLTEAAQQLGVSARSVYRYLKAGRFPDAWRLDRSAWRIPAADVRALAEQLNTGTADLDLLPDDVAEKLQLSRCTVLRMLRAGRFTGAYHRPGGPRGRHGWRIPPAAVDEYVRDRQAARHG